MEEEIRDIEKELNKLDKLYEPKNLLELWDKAHFYFLNLRNSLLTIRARLKLFPEIINYENNEEWHKTLREIEEEDGINIEDPAPDDTPYGLSAFLKIDEEQIEEIDIRDKKSILTVMHYSYNLSFYFSLCSTYYKGYPQDGIEKDMDQALGLFFKIEKYIYDVILLAGGIMGHWESKMEEKFKRDIQRTRKSTKTIQAKKNEMKQYIMEAYYRDSRTTGKMRPHTMAREISDYLKKNKLRPPSLDTIKRFLTEEGLI